MATLIIFYSFVRKVFAPSSICVEHVEVWKSIEHVEYPVRDEKSL
jgi:hypothetical protein